MTRAPLASSSVSASRPARPNRSYLPSGSGYSRGRRQPDEPLDRALDGARIGVGDDPPIELAEDLARVARRQHREDLLALTQVVEQLARDELSHAGLGPQQHERGVGIGHRPQRLAPGDESGKAHDRRHRGAPEKGVGYRTTRRLDVTVERDLELVDERRTASQEPLEGLQERVELARPIQRAGPDDAKPAWPSRRCARDRLAPVVAVGDHDDLAPCTVPSSVRPRRGRTEKHEAVGGPHDPAFEAGAEPAMQPRQRLGHRVAGPWIAELRDPWHAG